MLVDRRPVLDECGLAHVGISCTGAPVRHMREAAPMRHPRDHTAGTSTTTTAARVVSTTAIEMRRFRAQSRETRGMAKIVLWWSPPGVIWCARLYCTVPNGVPPLRSPEAPVRCRTPHGAYFPTSIRTLAPGQQRSSAHAARRRPGAAVRHLRRRLSRGSGRAALTSWLWSRGSDLGIA